MHELTTPDWLTPASTPTLERNTIDLWWIDLTVQTCHPDWLDKRERQRMAAFKGEALQKRYCASRCALRAILAGYLGLAPDAVQINISEHGKPALADDHPLQFNLSHCGDWALIGCTLADSIGAESTGAHSIGVDVEAIRTINSIHAIARRVFSPLERQRLSASAQPTDLFFQTWTALEARQKCHGVGIFGNPISTDQVGTSTLHPQSGYIANVAWQPANVEPQLRYWRLTGD